MFPLDWEDCLLCKRTHKSKQGDLLGITVLFLDQIDLGRRETNALFKIVVIKHIRPSILREDRT